jgi:hypothetical protein
MDMRKLFVSLFFISGLVFCQAAVASTNVSRSQSGTWSSVAGSPYILVGCVTIEKETVLAFEPWFEIQANNFNYNIDVNKQMYQSFFIHVWLKHISEERENVC